MSIPSHSGLYKIGDNTQSEDIAPMHSDSDACESIESEVGNEGDCLVRCDIAKLQGSHILQQLSKDDKY